MNLSEFSRKGGLAKSSAKTAANRKKMKQFWQRVRRREVAAPRRRRHFSDDTLALARRFIWWEAPEDSLQEPLRVIAQVLDLGTFEDWALLKKTFGLHQLRRAVREALPGWFRPKSWTYWHYRLGLVPWGAEVPDLPNRSFHESHV